jgi:hypothetical protein
MRSEQSAISLSWWVCAFPPGPALNRWGPELSLTQPTSITTCDHDYFFELPSFKGAGCPIITPAIYTSSGLPTRERRTAKPQLYRSVGELLHVDSGSREREPHLGWTDSSCSISGGYQVRARVQTRRAPSPSPGRAFELRAAYATTAKADESQG